MIEWLHYLALFGVGFVAGTLNVVAGGGSFLTLPVLIFLGLPPVVANGTNRVAILLQNIGAVWGFHRHRIVDWQAILWAAAPATIGAVFGAWMALSVGDATFKRILAFLMIALTLWTLWDPLKNRDFSDDSKRVRTGAVAAGFLVVGIYAGFVQAGVGFLILATTTLAGLDLVRGNAVKVLSLVASTTMSLGIFAWQGKVYWWLGLTLAAGTVLGGLLGVRLTVLKGHSWVKGVVTAAVILFALKLWFTG